MKHSLMMLALLASLLFNSCSNGQTTESDSTKTLHYLALGDSYTIGQSVPSEENFPHQLVKRANEKDIPFDEPEIIAKTGWRTDQLISKLEATQLLHKKYDLITLLIGVNDEFQGESVSDYEIQFRIILDKAIQLAGNDSAKVWVFSIPDYGFTPFGKLDKARISKRIDEYNEINKRIAKEKNVHYLDITALTRTGLDKPDLVAFDDLHPSGKMYALWINEFFSQFKP